MFDLIDSETCPICFEGDSDTVGLQWEEVGAIPPYGCTEIKNEELGFALRQKLYFSKDELTRMNLLGLSFQNYVKASDLSNDRNVRRRERYFIPVETDYSLFSDKLMHSLQPSEIKKYVPSLPVIKIIINELKYPPLFDYINEIVVSGLLSNSNSEPLMRRIQALNRRGCDLLATIHDSYGESKLTQELFSAVDSYLLIKQIWSEDIPMVSENYGSGPQKRKLDQENLAEELSKTDSYGYQIYKYFFPPPPVHVKATSCHDNLNLQHEQDIHEIEYPILAQERRNCRKKIGRLLKERIPRRLMRENNMYVAICKNEHQVCVGCALKLNANHRKCPICREKLEIGIVDRECTLNSRDMRSGPTLYLRCFHLLLPFYITITNWRFEDYYDMPLDEKEMNKIEKGYDFSCITGASKSRGSDLINTFDIQCHENSKVQVELHTASTMPQNGVSVQITNKFSRLRRTQSMQYIDEEWTHANVPETRTSEQTLSPYSCGLLYETEFGYQRWNTSIDIQFKDSNGFVFQSAVVNIDKLPIDKWIKMDTDITNEYSSYINPINYRP